MEKKTNLEMLLWGVQHIAENHGQIASTEDYEEEMTVCIFGKTPNIPTVADMRQLAEEVGLDPYDDVEVSDCGVDIYLTEEWMEDKADEPFEGAGLWRRIA